MAGIRDIDLSEDRVISKAFRSLQEPKHTTNHMEAGDLVELRFTDMPVTHPTAMDALAHHHQAVLYKELEEVEAGLRCERCGELRTIKDRLTIKSLLCEACDIAVETQIVNVTQDMMEPNLILDTMEE